MFLPVKSGAAEMTQPVIGFGGMTHLGLVSGVAASEKGFKVVCFDPAAARVAALRKGDLPVSEPQLEPLVSKNAARLSFTSSTADLRACDVIYVAPDVPTDGEGASDLDPIDALLARVFDAARADAVIVVLSQVPPGYTRGKQRDGRILYYQVETLIFGRAVERALQPERFIVGCADPAAPLPAAYRSFLEAHGCPILPMRYESAELAKISINCCLIASVTVANTLAELSERIGADWSEIAPALRLDRRIGQHSYLAPGLGIAGGNLERDLATVLRISQSVGSEASTIQAFLDNSAHRRDWALRTLHGEVFARNPDATIGVLGLAYKENTHSTKNSPSLALIQRLKPWAIRVYDPVVPPSAADHPKAVGAKDALDVAKGVDALAVMTPWPAFTALKPADLARAMRGKTVLDPYRVLDGAAVAAAGLDYLTLGAPPLRARAGN